jgi:acetolactate synthase-1/3 small subunit
MTVSTHTLSILVEDKPGVLARVASLFSRRGFNIQSLAVGATEHKNLSRMTIVVSVEDLYLEQVSKQLHKLINVIKVVEQEEDKSVSRELALIKVRADAATREGHRRRARFPDRRMHWHDSQVRGAAACPRAVRRA